MARARALAAAIVACAALAAGAQAQTLQRLTVREFTLSADTASPKAEQPFHLIVLVRVKERVASIDNLDLPILAELELLGDERRVTSDRSGTLYREVIGVVAHHSGDIHVAPATIDALDPRDKRGKRYFSNDLTLHVAGASGAPIAAAEGAFASVAGVVLAIAGTVLGIAAAIFVVVALLRRRTPVAPPEPPREQPPAAAPRDALLDGLLTLRAEHSRAAAMSVRSLVRHVIGASDAETLADVLRRPGAYDPRMRDVLRTLERAAFTYDADLSAAIADAIASLEHATT